VKRGNWPNARITIAYYDQVQEEDERRVSVKSPSNDGGGQWNSPGADASVFSCAAAGGQRQRGVGEWPAAVYAFVSE